MRFAPFAARWRFHLVLGPTPVDCCYTETHDGPATLHISSTSRLDSFIKSLNTIFVPRLCRLACRAGLPCPWRPSPDDRRREPSYPGSGDSVSPWARGTRKVCAGLGRRSSLALPDSGAENSLPRRTHLPADFEMSKQISERGGYRLSLNEGTLAALKQATLFIRS